MTGSVDTSWDGQHVSVSCQHEKIKVYCADTAEYENVGCTMIQKYGVGLVRFTQDSFKLIASSYNGWDESIKYLDLKKNMYFCYFKGHRSIVRSISFAYNGNSSPHAFISGSMDDTFRLWDLRTTRTQALVHEPSPSVSFDPMGLIVACATLDGLLKLFDIRYLDGPAFASFNISQRSTSWSNISFSPNGQLIVLSTMQEKIFIIDSSTGRVARIFHRPNLESVEIEASISPNSKFLLSGSSDGAARIWDIEHENQIALWKCNDDIVSHVRWSPSRELAICSGGNLTFWAPKL